MPYGLLNPAQRAAVARHVRGKVVHDLGAGDLGLSRELLRFGAAKVYAVDRAPKPPLSPWPKRLHYMQSYFHDVFDRMDVIFASWPVNHEANLLPHLLAAGTIIYLGCNTGGSACGTPGLFEVLVRRELLDYIPDRHNSLVVVGRYLDGPREPTGEEYAGLTIDTKYMSFAEAERIGL